MGTASRDSRKDSKQQTICGTLQQLVDAGLFPASPQEFGVQDYTRVQRIQSWMCEGYPLPWLIKKLVMARELLGSTLLAVDQFDPDEVLLRNGNCIRDLRGQMYFDFPDTMYFERSSTCPIPKVHLYELAVEAELEHRFESAIELYQSYHMHFGVNAESCFRLGNSLFGACQYPAALERFRQSIELDTTAAETWNQLGNCYLKLNQSGEAFRAYCRSIELDPAIPEPHLNAGLAAEKLGNWSDAQQHFNTYLELNPTSHRRIELQDRMAKSQNFRKSCNFPKLRIFAEC